MQPLNKFFFFLFLCFFSALNCFSYGDSVSVPFKGIYVCNKWIKPVEDYVLKSNAVDGVHLRLRWNMLQPEENKFDWSFLDAELKRIADAGKKISIGVAAGKFTPDWVYSKGAPQLEFVEFRKQGRGNKFSANIPVVWNKIFLESWTGFVKSFADHLKSMPVIYQDVTLIKLTGINETTLELRLPAQQSIENEKGKSTDASLIWRNAGYRPQLVLDAWSEIVDVFYNNFNDKSVSIELIPNKAFPALDDSGKDATESVAQNLTEQFVAKAHEKFHSRLVLQWNSLQPGGIIPSIINLADKFQVAKGYQVQESGVGNPACLTDNSECDEEMFKSLFDRGINAGGVFIEIFPKDVIAYPKGMEYGHELLWK